MEGTGPGLPKLRNFRPDQFTQRGHLIGRERGGWVEGDHGLRQRQWEFGCAKGCQGRFSQ